MCFSSRWTRGARQWYVTTLISHSGCLPPRAITVWLVGLGKGGEVEVEVERLQKTF